MGFESKATTLLLLHNATSLLLYSMHNSFKIELIQAISAAVIARDMYSDSILDVATTLCFLALYDIRLFPK